MPAMLALTLTTLLLLFTALGARAAEGTHHDTHSVYPERGRRAPFNLRDMEEDGFRKVHVYRRPRKKASYSEVAANLVIDGLTYVQGRRL